MSRFPFPLPDGWFQVAYADELAPGELRTVHYFDQDLVLYRSEGGEARAVDPHCPHLGAHLGVGGRVEGDRLRCPFHAWEFGGDGRCVKVPYAQKIPPKARLRTWPLLERNGMLFVFHDKQGRAPTWEPPTVPEHGSPDWTDDWRRDWEVESCAQEMAENSVDPAHFKYVHRTAALPEASARSEGHVFHVDMGYPIQMGGELQQGTIAIDCFGFGVGVTRFRGIVDTTVVATGTPIDAGRMHHRLSFRVRRLESDEATQGLGQAFIAEITRQFEEDKPIWERKVHLARPALCDGDGPIGELRRWGRQFY